ncbi:MAG: phospholipid carrier-dependent glycosyltransferase [Verrucomicrobiae bacterium]|nr:phospholipid carrier-dependent glycosyltransferase [Verrucomicrobiae bacterium]
MSRPIHRAAVVALSVYFLGVGIWAARTHTPTVDEFAQVPIGLYHWRTGRFDFDTRNPPLMKLWASAPVALSGAKLPELKPEGPREGWFNWRHGSAFLRDNKDNYFYLFFLARLAVLILALGGGFLLKKWAGDWLGPAGGLLAFFLYTTDPTILGHASLATVDVGTTVFTLAAFLATWRLATTGRLGWAIAAGVSFGLALGSKLVVLFLLPAAPALLAWQRRCRGEWKRRPLAIEFGAMALCAWLAFLACYGFTDFPLPRAALHGIHLKAADTSTEFSPSFLMGEWSTHGWWWYDAVAILVKFPVPLLLLAGAGIWASRTGGLPRGAWLWIALPTAVLLEVLSFHYHINYGVRYLLPVVPFFLLLAAAGAKRLLAGGRRERLVASALLAWQLLTSALNSPHQLAYFNELVGGPDRARHVLLDSNLDWGQDLGRLAAELKAHPRGKIYLGYFGSVDPAIYGIDYRLPPSEPAAGFYAISANYLAGYPYPLTYRGKDPLKIEPGAWTWLDDLEPVGRVGRSIYLFEVKAPVPGNGMPISGTRNR